MKSTKTKLTIRLIEVEGSSETITSIIKSLGDLFPASENGAVVQVKRTRKKTESELPIAS